MVGLLKLTLGVAAALSLAFGTWEPLTSVLTLLAVAFGTIFLAWVVPMWLLGKSIELATRCWAGLHREKGLKHGAT